MSDERHASKKCLGVYSFTLDLLLAALMQYSLQISFNLIIAHATAQVDSSYHGDVLIVISVLPQIGTANTVLQLNDPQTRFINTSTGYSNSRIDITDFLKKDYM
jgi:hypothetical protein